MSLFDFKTSAQIAFNALMLLRNLKETPVDLSMESTAEILSRLKFLGQIQKNDKIFVKNLTKQPDGWITRFARSFLSPDNRVNTLKFVKDVISRSFDILKTCLAHEDEKKIDARIIIKDLIRAQQGIVNLKETYSDDIKFCCDMDVFIEHIIFRLEELKKEHPHLFANTPQLSSLTPESSPVPQLLEDM